jgi:hypothetical protein
VGHQEKEHLRDQNAEDDEDGILDPRPPVPEIGLFALAFGFLGQLLGVYQVLCVLRDVGFEQEGVAAFFQKVPLGVIFAGLKVTMNCFIYGVIIYLVSLVVRVVKKPRL